MLDDKPFGNRIELNSIGILSDTFFENTYAWLNASLGSFNAECVC